jgi:hypothetical protein
LDHTIAEVQSQFQAQFDAFQHETKQTLTDALAEAHAQAQLDRTMLIQSLIDQMQGARDQLHHQFDEFHHKM